MFLYKAITAAVLLSAGAVGYRYLHSQPTVPSVQIETWRAVSPAYVKEALAEPALNQVPFCASIATDQSVSAMPACAAYLAQNPKQEICAVQNLKKGKWDPKVIQGDGALAAANIATWMAGLECHTLFLDMESTKDRVATSKWVTDLAQGLRAKDSHYRLSIAVHAKVTDEGNWVGAASQDWRAFCQAADEIMIMAYDFNFPGITRPGETAPIPWVGEVLKFAVTECPVEKLRLGLAAYGYNFKTKAIVTERQWIADGKPVSDSVFVETAAQREEKIQLALSQGINKFFLWAAGMDQPLVAGSVTSAVK